MSDIENGYRLTNHAKEQFVKRFPKLAEDNVAVTLFRLFYESKDMPSVFNNTGFLVYHMKRYGDFDTRYRENGNMVFVINTKAKLVMTVFDRRSDDEHSVFRSHLTSKRYRKQG